MIRCAIRGLVRPGGFAILAARAGLSSPVVGGAQPTRGWEVCFTAGVASGAR